MKATAPHISMVGNITEGELKRHLSSVDLTNGFFNRMIWVMSKRTKLLAHGGQFSNISLASLVERFQAALRAFPFDQEIRFNSEAHKAWESIYADLQTQREGMARDATARSAPIVLRLACIYAVLDGTPFLNLDHLQAAVAVWKYADQSAEYLFGEFSGNRLADEILTALEDKPDGLTRTEIRNHFNRHKSSAEIETALENLNERGLTRVEHISTKGRPVETWFVVLEGEN